MKKIAGNPYLIKEESDILIDSLRLSNLLEKSKTPFFIFLENKIRDNVRTFNRVFKSLFDNFQVFYSFKANFLPEICKIIHSEGIGAELVGLPELKLALEIGFPPEKIIIGGPYLTKEIIEMSIDKGVKEIIVYNIKYLKQIDIIAKKLNKIQNICLRIRSSKFESKLGIQLTNKNLIELASSVKNYKNIKLTTILSHYATQMNSLEQFNKNIKTLANAFHLLSGQGLNPMSINLGGGFPEATIMSEEQLENLVYNIKQQLENYNLDGKNIYLEPGRYFVGDSGLIIAKIVNKTDNRWIFLDIGNHICPKFAKCSLRFYNASQINSPHKYKTSIGGIIPTDQDVLAKDYFFTKEFKEEEIVLVTNVGAYTLTFSNRFPYGLPNIFLVKNKNIKQIFNRVLDHDFSLV
ncbi:MAG: diaminopimelate decarboxylase family protein [Candidatus Odinarchaeota archaeon]